MARQANLLSVEEAQRRILACFGRLPAELSPLSQAADRVLGEDVYSRLDIPPFRNSSMDGFAVKASDTVNAAEDSPLALPVVAHIPAGYSEHSRIDPRTCARIMTGAPLPEGSDAVVPFEEVTEGEDSIVLSVPIREGACVRAAGQDVRSGQKILPSGTGLTPPAIALLASVGIGSVSVVCKPRVSIMSTGDELATPGEPLPAGHIYNSNSPMIEAAVREAGGAPKVLDSVTDDPASIAHALHSAADSDLILTSGGASVGDFDHVKAVIGENGELNFWRVRVRPGKPLLFGFLSNTPIIGLPGNPTSAMVTFELFARPAIRAMLGATLWRPAIRAVSEADIDNGGGRRSFIRVRLRFQGERFHAIPAGAQDSAMILPLASADGLMVVPEEREKLNAGEWAEVLVWRLPSQSGNE